MIQLTDDEVAAVSVGTGQSWRGWLPTVDESDMRGILSAALRGRVALIARDLLAIDAQSDDSVLRPVALVAGQVPAVCMYAARRESPQSPVGRSAALYGAGDGVVAELCDAAGLHQFESMDADAGRELVMSAVREAFREGLGHEGTELVVIVTSTATAAVRLVAKGTVTEAGLADESAELVTAESTQTLVDSEFLAWLSRTGY